MNEHTEQTSVRGFCVVCRKHPLPAEMALLRLCQECDERGRIAAASLAFATEQHRQGVARGYNPSPTTWGLPSFSNVPTEDGDWQVSPLRASVTNAPPLVVLDGPQPIQPAPRADFLERQGYK